MISLNKYEHWTFQSQNAAWVFYMNIFLKGTGHVKKYFNGIFILSDKAAFMSISALCTVITNKPVSCFCSDQRENLQFFFYAANRENVN